MIRMSTRGRTGVVAVALVTTFVALVAACSDDETDNDGNLTDSDASANADGATNPPGDDDDDDDVDGSTNGDASAYPAVPGVLSVTGCTSLGIGPLCSVTQTDDKISVNCAGKIFTGTVSKTGDLTFATTQAVDGGVPASCTGRIASGQVTATCTGTGTDGGAQTCNLVSDKQILPGVTCQELPAQIDNVSICTGEGASGSTINAGSCKIIQDGCFFQAECANNLVLTGNVTRTGVTFTQRLVALADAQTSSSGTVAFTKGESVNHSCVGTLNGTDLTGTCSAGASGRGGTATSVCAIGGKAPAAVPACSNLTDTTEKLFVLDSCTELKDGFNQEPGIGQPVCIYRQNNCIWEVNCGNDPLLTFTGRLQPGATGIEWRLLTGTPCEAKFDATGKVSGSCTVPGQAACALSSTTSVPGQANVCPALPIGTQFYTHGCGPFATECRVALQHGCEFMAACSYGPSYPDVLVAGTASFVGGRSHLSFNGLADYQCVVDQATETEISSGDRATNEWYGQCTNSAGGQCRNNYDPVTKTGFRGLRLYFGTPPTP